MELFFLFVLGLVALGFDDVRTYSVAVRMRMSERAKKRITPIPAPRRPFLS